MSARNVSSRPAAIPEDRPENGNGRPSAAHEFSAETPTAQMKVAFAEQLQRLEAQFTEQADDPEAAKQALTKMLSGAADFRAAEASDWTPQPLAFDFEAEPEAPEWAVHGLIERGTVVVLSGDTGAAKSIAVQSLLPAALDGEDWLGHSTHVERVLVVDEENPERLVKDRIRALGTSNDTRDRLRYFNREGVAIGDTGRSDVWLRGQFEDFRPDLLIIDTLMAACDLEDTNSNAEAVRMMKFLRALAREYECAVLLLHHERKRSKEHPASSGQAMMGARQWAGQADAHMTLTTETDLTEEDAENGCRRLRRTFKWRPAEKDRDGRPNIPRRVAVESEKDSKGRLVWMTVTDEGEIEDVSGERESLAVAIAGLVQRGEEEMATAAIAAGVARDSQDSTFKRALLLATERKYIQKAKRGSFRAGAERVLDA
jgi:hypothetical protein